MNSRFSHFFQILGLQGSHGAWQMSFLLSQSGHPASIPFNFLFLLVSCPLSLVSLVSLFLTLVRVGLSVTLRSSLLCHCICSCWTHPPLSGSHLFFLCTPPETISFACKDVPGPGGFFCLMPPYPLNTLALKIWSPVLAPSEYLLKLQIWSAFQVPSDQETQAGQYSL